MFYRRSEVYFTVEVIGVRPDDFDKLRVIFGLYAPELLCYLQHVPESTKGKIEVLAEGIPYSLFETAGMQKFIQSEWKFFILRNKKEIYYVTA